jgi:hypothetical protein
MKATEVRVLPALDPGESYIDPVFMLVETAAGDDGEPVTTIDQISTASVDGAEGWVIATLGQSVPMAHAAACVWAVSFAASRNIPLVYERDETVDSTYAAALNEPLSASSASK